MKIKLPVLATLAIGLIAVGAQAMNLKAVVFTAEEIVNLIKRGKASSASLVEAEFFRSSPTKHALLGSFKRAGKGDMHILISREKGEGMDVLKIHLVSPLDESVKKSIEELPNTYIMHGDIGEVGKKALVDSGLKEEGLRIMQELVNSRLVTITEESIYSIMEKIKAVRASGMNIQQRSGNILLDQTFNRQTHNGAIESLDLAYIKNLADAGPAASFEIRLAITESTTPEHLRRVMQIISSGAETAF